MSFELKFTPEAEDTFDAVVSQLEQRWGKRFVLKFENKLSKTFKTIERTPDIYPVINKDTGLRRCVIHENCSILFKIYDHDVLIICFWDNRQEPLFEPES